VKAFVVPRRFNENGLRESLYEFCRRHMPPQLVPQEVVLLQKLPKNSAGKVLRSSLKSI
jgi:acyl-coenzyme A synthetase/AMP-(fatty) acid ligase